MKYVDKSYVWLTVDAIEDVVVEWTVVADDGGYRSS